MEQTNERIFNFRSESLHDRPWLSAALSLVSWQTATKTIATEQEEEKKKEKKKQRLEQKEERGDRES